MKKRFTKNLDYQIKFINTHNIVSYIYSINTEFPNSKAKFIISPIFCFNFVISISFCSI